MLDYKVRAYIYRVTLAVLPLLVLWGVLAEQDVPVYVAAVGGILDVALAVKHTPVSGADDEL